MLNEKEKQAIDMLNKFITEHKLFNIKHSDGLEKNINVVLNLITKLQKENEEKDKQIDLMAEEIEYNGCIKRVWNCEEKSCKECIKQYFKEIAEEK